MERGETRGGAATVVFEAGMAASRSWWALVQPIVAQWTRTIAYDRAGLGRSPADTSPRSMERMADDLNDLLDQLGAGPFILVGHSAGGPIIRAATSARPERIAGLVLVDTTDEACDALFDPKFRKFERVAHRVTVVLARLGLLGFLYRNFVAALPDDAKEDMRKEGFTNAAIATRGAELTGLVAGMNAFRRASPALPDIPVVSVSGALADMGMSPEIRAAANASHKVRAGQVPHGRHVLALKSGHGVPVTEPEVVAEEIRRILESVDGD